MQPKLKYWDNYPQSVRLGQVIDERLSIYYTYTKLENNSFAFDLFRGLSSEKKFLLPKYFYDCTGSELFEEICKTDEYYVTRTETSILEKFSKDIIGTCKKAESITELGSGASIKTRYLIDSFIGKKGYLHYSPIDVSSILIESSEKLIQEIPEIKISGIISEYESGIELVNELLPEPKLIIFLGSSIGNFDLQDAKNFIKFIADNMIDEDKFLIGFDMVKDVKVLNDAYNDRTGFTAKFNLNLLNRINIELGGNFDLNKFEHHAFFNEKESRVEMHLTSKVNQSIKIKSINENILFHKDETIHTENSYKFTDEMIEDIASYAGLRIVNKWLDGKGYFSLILFTKI
jgi:L-histidine N-alpha-methyltransferase